jgi:predicted ATPase/class 3 adenylate cyclase
MDSKRSDIEAAIAALETQRAVLGDAVVDTALAPLKERLVFLGAATDAESLRIMSVLFLDIVGSTAMSRALDPEDTRAIFHSAMREFSSVVATYEGQVLRYIGDGMLAVFGARGVREDDAERAVRCGLALIEEAKALAPRFEREHEITGFAIRVGISTGPVLLSAGVNEGDDVSGITVNIAARMEQTAPPGSLRISQSTYSHVRGLFDAVAQPPLAVKGVEEPIVTYLVQRANPRTFATTSRGIQGAALPVIGREDELQRLTDAFGEVANNRTCKLVLVAGEAGLGKSRLLCAFSDWLAGQAKPAVCLYARSQPFGVGIAYGVVRDIFFWRFAISDGDTLPDAKRKLSDGLQPIFKDRSAEQTALIGQLIGLDFASSPHIAGIANDPKQLRDRGFHAAGDFLRQLAERDNTVIVLIDDMHWADEGSLDFIRHLNATCAESAILCVGGARPELFAQRVSKTDLGPYQRVDIRELAGQASRALAEALLQRVESPPNALYDLIVGGADGNPFYMEEIVRMLIDEGAIVAGPDRWEVDPERLVEFRVPETLTGVLQARIDALSVSERTCLQVASVVGPVFWDEAVAQIKYAETRALPDLVSRHILDAHEDSAFFGMREFGFHHHLLHRVAYDSVLKRAKREYHRQIAHWLVSRTRERAGEFSGLVAHHFERAGDPASAIVHLTEAAAHAQRRYQNQIAIDYLTRALALTPEDDLSGRFELLMRKREVHMNAATGLDQEEDVAMLERLAERLDSDSYRARAASARTGLGVVHGDFESAARAAERVIQLSEFVLPSTVCFAWINWGRAVQYLGNHAQAQKHVEEGLRLARQTGEHRLERIALCQLGLIEGDLGRFSRAKSYFTQVLKMSRDSGDKAMESVIINNLASAEHCVGNNQRARELLEAAQRLCREIGSGLTGAYALGVLASVIAEQGDSGASLDLSAEAVRQARRFNAKDLEARCLVIMGEAQAKLGRWDDAVALYEASIELFRAMNRPMMLRLPMSKLADIELKRGNPEAAMRHVAHIVPYLESRALNEHGTAEMLFACFQVMAAVGDAHADEFLQRAYDTVIKQADQLDERDRSTFLASNSAVVEAWRRRHGSPDGPATERVH